MKRLQRLRSKMTYSNVMATVAVVIAVAGGSTAIAVSSKAPKNSVTSKSIKPGNVTSKDLTRIVGVTVEAQLSDPSPGDGIDATVALRPTCPTGARVISAGGGGAQLVSLLPGDSVATVVLATDRPGILPVSANARCLLRHPGTPTG